MNEVLIEGPADLSKSLGQVRVVSLDKEAGRAAIEYRCGMHMCHSGGVAQGGFVTGWIDAAMAHATMAATGFDMVPMTLEIKVSFFQPAAPGLVTAEAWIERRGRSTVFVEGLLRNAQGDVLAKATSTIRLVPRAKLG
ncbi:MAG: PaaI family thioesterase [Parvibaculum sp.]|uniref:PaaI family thioesterase n=1 Tax=Parvibaculum sp. TaxID=2024848 RepID=UPI0025F5F91A|nr:PaaI family thioesterase [Parvibaculum sp.]MCE9651225.1 PaaI family thioesterase [Parvibaculum sp.]